MEYAGYVRRGAPTDWSKVTGDIAQRIGAVEESREKERDKLEKLFADTTKVIGDVEMGMNPEFNETILYTADKARDLVYDAYKKLKSGQMSPREYRNIQNNVQARWAEYDTAVKQKNNRFAEIEKRTREGTNSEMELWQNKKAAEMAAFKEYSLEWGSNGNLVYAKRDDKGNIIPGSVMPISALNKTPNVLVDRFNLTEKVGKYKKNFGAFEIEEGGFILGGAAVEEKFNKAKESVIGSLYTNDNDYGRALVDSGYDNFVLYQEGEEVPEGTTEDGTPLAIKMVLDKESKTWTSVPTEKQKAYARRMAGQAIDTMVGYKKRKVKQPSTPRPSGKDEGEMAGYMLSNQWAQGQNIDKIKSFKSPQGDKVTNVENLKNTIRITTVDSKGNPKYHNLTKGKPEEFMPWAYKSSMGAAGQEGSYLRGEQFYKQKHGKPFSVAAASPQDIKPYSLKNYGTDYQDQQKTKYKEILSTNSDTAANEATIKSDVKSILSTTLASVGVEDFNDNDINIEWIQGEGFNNDKIKVSIKGGKVVKEIELDRVSPGDKGANDMNTKIEAIVNDYITHYNKTLKAGGTTKKSVSQLTKENPNLTKAEIIKLYKNQ
tara:strand:+ start:24922 stop:26724 length:1803 start_codon:yes stop_codon:yes gene_type:complete